MKNKILYILSVLCLTACQEVENWLDSNMDDAVELKGIEASVYGSASSRAAALDKDHYVGRSAFVDRDQMVLTTIKRTQQTSPAVNSIPGFSYSDIVYNHVVGSGQTYGGWNRDNTRGRTDASANIPDRIYWSDAANWHTYIGYSVPQQEQGKDFDWNMRNVVESSQTVGIDTYYGSLGDPTLSNDYIDHTSNPKIIYDDLLLTYDDKKVAETGGSVAKLLYHHALANVRVVVNISGFSATSESADARSVVKDMVLKNMLTMYKWRQQTFGAQALDETYDNPKLSGIYTGLTDGHTVPAWNQKKDTRMWIPRPDGTGDGVGKQFVFYALAVPTTMAAQELKLNFTVTYQDPMNPWNDAAKTEPNMKSHNYTATMPQAIEFRAGYCTTINISLNHNNEEMTVGAEYMDWQFIDTPDEGELKKNSTFMTHADREKVTIFGDEKATVDDATWLYIDPEAHTVGGKTYPANSLRDIYGHYGTSDDPFVISTANQLLSFAYEVAGTQRSAGKTYYNAAQNTSVTTVAGTPFDFSGYYVKLDADITMQANINMLHDASGFYTLNSEGNKVTATGGVTWPGIGDASHMFNGFFNGGYRHINKLYGEPFFNTVGADGIVDHIFITDALGITGRGSIAEVNNGVICGAYIEGNVLAINDNTNTAANTAEKCCGSIVGENHSMLISCAHIGDITGSGYETVGALLGYNDGIVAICYNCGNVTSTGSGEHTYAGIGEYTPQSIAYCSYFNGDLFHGHDYNDLNQRIGHVAYPLTTAMMQSNVFVNKDAPMDNTINKSHEIINDGLPLQEDPFFFHLSLNYGIRRAVAMLKTAMNQTADSDGYIPIHAAKTGDNPFEVLRLKKSLVKWLIDHYSTENTPGGTLEFSHQFQFIPGTYPKLK